MKILISNSAVPVKPSATKEQAMLALHHLNRAMNKSQDKFALIGNQLALQHKISETGYKNLRLGFFVFTFEGKKLRTMQAQDPCKRMPVVKVGTQEEVHKFYARVLKSYMDYATPEGSPTINMGASAKLNKEALKILKKSVPKIKLVDNTFALNGVVANIIGYRIPNPAVATLSDPTAGIVFTIGFTRQMKPRPKTLSKLLKPTFRTLPKFAELLRREAVNAEGESV